MNELMKKCIEFANNNPTAWLATAVDDQPSVRGLWMWYADETGFYFHTAKAKRMCQQIEKNPKVAATFYHQESETDFATLHVEGVMEEVKDEALMKKLLEERGWLQDNINRSGVATEVVIYRIAHGKAFIWDMSWNVHESQIPKVEF